MEEIEIKTILSNQSTKIHLDSYKRIARARYVKIKDFTKAFLSPESKKGDLKVGDIILWVDIYGFLWKNMIIGFSKDGEDMYIDSYNFWKSFPKNRSFDIVTTLAEVDQKAYIENIQNEVRATSVLTFYQVFHKNSNHNTGDSKSEVNIFKSLSDDVNNKGFCLIKADDSITGKDVAFYNHFCGKA